MSEKEERADKHVRATEVLLGDDATAEAVKLQGFALQLKENGLWGVYDPDNDGIIVDMLQPARFRSSGSILRYLARLEDVTTETPDDPRREVH